MCLAKRISIFIFGLDRVGKTTIVEFLKEKKFLPQNPTIGVSISQIVFQFYRLVATLNTLPWPKENIIARPPMS